MKKYDSHYNPEDNKYYMKNIKCNHNKSPRTRNNSDLLSLLDEQSGLGLLDEQGVLSLLNGQNYATNGKGKQQPPTIRNVPQGTRYLNIDLGELKFGQPVLIANGKAYIAHTDGESVWGWIFVGTLSRGRYVFNFTGIPGSNPITANFTESTVFDALQPMIGDAIYLTEAVQRSENGFRLQGSQTFPASLNSVVGFYTKLNIS
ncbi:hypothetical protein [Priestia aryabhattai]|uniref:hypothetical protein n=1 Tax=Priestia aryabhattai TaxID=412384 RepID=UPI0023802691|nr:hypothetical protein [Priestia aryabhattai]WDW11563.1 hypothetical protein PWC21_26965 [Priestia aryabhattai]